MKAKGLKDVKREYAEVIRLVRLAKSINEDDLRHNRINDDTYCERNKKISEMYENYVLKLAVVCNKN